ncbi:sortase [Rubrobacter marinus]|nr:sortase [Rubrobacter marinus]
MFKSLKASLLLVSLALLGLGALPAYPTTETASLDLRPTEVENARTLLGESPGGEKAQPGSGGGRDAGTAGPGGAPMTLSIPKLGLEDVEVPTADSQVALDREGIIRLKGTGSPWQEGSNTVIVGHALGYVFTKVPYVFYELDEMEPGDEIVLENQAGEEFTFRVYDRLVVRPEDYWVTYPVQDKTIVSLQTCTPIPSFEKRLIVRAERVG